MVLLYLIPKNWLSRLVGALVHWHLPSFLRLFAIRQFARYYKIDVSEASRDLESYQSIGDFFVRQLKAPARPVGEEPLLHPADSVITECGLVQNGQAVQAKGQYYTLDGLLGGRSFASSFQEGAFITYYLCPTDYHRVHSPVDGSVRRVLHIPGALWPVNAWSTRSIRELFCVNERVVVEIESAYGPVAVVFVGATNVGQISLSFWPGFRTNEASVTERRERNFGREVLLTKGQELGTFHMGSTVVMLLSPEFLSNMESAALALPRLRGHRVRVNSNFTSTVASVGVGAHPAELR